MLGPPSINLADYAISAKNGFLPDEYPLQELSSPYYNSWELTINQLPGLLEASSFRHTLDQLPILSTSHLISEQEWRRAYLILSFFTHSYIWENGGPSEILPAQISIPFLEVAARLDLPPTATYAALNLWNFAPTHASADLSRVENLRTLHTFTGTPDESWFYLISVSIEAHGASVIPMMLRAIDACAADNSYMVLSALTKFAFVVREIGVLLKKMNEGCDPMVFYNKIRPFLAGSKNMGVAGLPRGVFYDEGDDKGEWRMYSGGSNAQSSIIQLFDIILGVDHHSTNGTKGTKNGFLKDMQTYMPGPHREFLVHLMSLNSPVREYARNSPIPEVVDAYNFAIKELSLFRDVHIGIVTRYIIRPARMTNPQMGNPGLNLAIASSRTGGKGEKGLHGTGGTELLPFLKQSRDETRATALA